MNVPGRVVDLDPHGSISLVDPDPVEKKLRKHRYRILLKCMEIVYNCNYCILKFEIQIKIKNGSKTPIVCADGAQS